MIHPGDLIFAVLIVAIFAPWMIAMLADAKDTTVTLAFVFSGLVIVGWFLWRVI